MRDQCLEQFPLSQYNDFTIVSGPSNVTLAETEHILVPGRGRDATGYDISRGGHDRVRVAAQLYSAHLNERNGFGFHGVIVTSGYKTPADKNGQIETYYDTAASSYKKYLGKPEAIAGRQSLIDDYGVYPAYTSAEMNSIDTVTNFVRSEQEGHFNRNLVQNGPRLYQSRKTHESPVAIIAQAGHLDRMLEVIAPKTLRRDYIGVIVPEDGESDPDSVTARIFSRVVSAGLQPTSRHAIGRTNVVAQMLWGGVLLAQKVRPSKTPYYTEID